MLPIYLAQAFAFSYFKLLNSKKSLKMGLSLDLSVIKIHLFKFRQGCDSNARSTSYEHVEIGLFSTLLRIASLTSLAIGRRFSPLPTNWVTARWNSILLRYLPWLTCHLFTFTFRQILSQSWDNEGPMI